LIIFPTFWSQIWCEEDIEKEWDGWRRTQRGEGSFQLKEEIDEKQRFATLLTLIEMSIVNLSYM
jgi:hypothetical protein